MSPMERKILEGVAATLNRSGKMDLVKDYEKFVSNKNEIEKEIYKFTHRNEYDREQSDFAIECLTFLSSLFIDSEMIGLKVDRVDKDNVMTNSAVEYVGEMKFGRLEDIQFEKLIEDFPDDSEEHDELFEHFVGMFSEKRPNGTVQSAVDGWQDYLLQEEKKTLNEGITDIVYHYTDLRSVYDILKTDRFRTSPAFEEDAEMNLGYNFYFSTTRSPLNSYTDVVLIKLDGRKFGYRYKARPVNFFGSGRSQDDNEMEDRIFTDRGFIPNASDYILEIRILVEEELLNSERSSDALRTGFGTVKNLCGLCEEKNIPLRLYTDHLAIISRHNKGYSCEDVEWGEDSYGPEFARGDVPGRGFQKYYSIIRKYGEREPISDEEQELLSKSADNLFLSLVSVNKSTKYRKDLENALRLIKREGYTTQEEGLEEYWEDLQEFYGKRGGVS